MNKLLIVIPLIAVIAFASGYIILSQQNPFSPGGPSHTPQPYATFQPQSSPSTSSPQNSAANNHPETNPTAQTTQNSATITKYKTVSFIDSQGIGTKAFSMLIPTEWQSSGNIKWVLDNPSMPASGSFKAWNPNGADEYNYYANQAYFWSNNPMLQQTFPTGTHYFGAEVRTPLSPTQALKEIALPNFRNNVQNLVVISEQQLPELSNIIKTGTDPATGVITSANGGKIHIEYTLNGVAMEEEMYCIIQSQDIPVQTLYGTTRNINWYMTYLESFRAAKGQLDPETKMFQTISHSAKTDANWLNKYNQVVNYLIQRQIQQIQTLGQLSNIISQTSNEISDTNYQAWEQTQQINDKIATDFSNYIRGVETYNNPIDGSKVDLPSGHEYAWANSLGDYILSDSPNYNPNLESNLDWQQMTP
jgi:hypothetical protein